MGKAKFGAAVLQVELTFTEPILGTKPGSKELMREFIIKKALREGRKLTDKEIEEELHAMLNVNEEEEKQTTFFSRTSDGKPALWDYMFKGLCKEACASLRDLPDSASHEIKAYKKRIDGQVFVYPRLIPLEMPDGGEIGIFERPLRADTAQGPRVCLARSEEVPAGTKCELEIHVLNYDLLDAVEEWLDYGELKGMGQFRNGSYGRFTYKWLNEKPKKKDKPKEKSKAEKSKKKSA